MDTSAPKTHSSCVQNRDSSDQYIPAEEDARMAIAKVMLGFVPLPPLSEEEEVLGRAMDHGKDGSSEHK